ncbi:MAG: hypothetical protein JWN62_151 [Acidimicrobiales bacterium]|nr:hypothetical protein [Acidimicrobiales bacterium]
MVKKSAAPAKKVAGPVAKQPARATAPAASKPVAKAAANPTPAKAAPPTSRAATSTAVKPTAAKVAPGKVPTSKIQDGKIQAAKILDGKIPSGKLPAAKVAAAKAPAPKPVAAKASAAKPAPVATAKPPTVKPPRSTKDAVNEAPAKKAAASTKAAAAPAPAAEPLRRPPARKPAVVAAPALTLPPPKGETKEGIKYTKDFDAKFLQAQHKLLMEARVSLTGQAVRLEDEANSLIDEEMGDVQFDDESGEGDTMVVERERDLFLSARARQDIEEIDAALARLSLGSYGYSVVSFRPIPRERLEAIPWATELTEEKVGGIGRR